MKIRGTLVVGLIGIFLLSADLIQRTVISFLVWALPSRRERILAWWIQRMADGVLLLVSIAGGARFGPKIKIPGKPGVLIVMNHQSILDIPVAVSCMRPLHPRIISRARYARGKPLVSHLIRLYQYPTVDPRATVKADLEELADAARHSPVPFMIYPEGTRSRDGAIAKLRRNGLRNILGSRDWEVHVVTIDGYWQCGKIKDFLSSVATIRGSLRSDGPFQFDGPNASEDAIEEFIDMLESRMQQGLSQLRGETAG